MSAQSDIDKNFTAGFGGSNGLPGYISVIADTYQGGLGAGWLSMASSSPNDMYGGPGGSRAEGWSGGSASSNNPGAFGGFGGGGGGSDGYDRSNGGSGGGGGFSGGGAGFGTLLNGCGGGGGGSFCAGSNCAGVTGGNTERSFGSVAMEILFDFTCA